MRTLVFDSEVYKDYYLASFLDVESGETFDFEYFAGCPFDIDGLAALVKGQRLVTFNGNHFDIPLLTLAVKGASVELIKRGCDAIINGNLKSWQFEDLFGVTISKKLNHIDLFEVAPGMASLKIYGGRLHCKRMQDMPIEPDASVRPEDRAPMREYCHNDLANTALLYGALKTQLDLRETMGETYKLDLRSKSDAQIAEALIVSEVTKALGAQVERPKYPPGSRFTYDAPPWLSQVRGQVGVGAVLALVELIQFTIPETGAVRLPRELEEPITIAGKSYRMGIGGLHSQEKSVAHVADADTLLFDRDVASYYPAIILNNGLAPAHMGKAFTATYKTILEQRLAAKAAGNKVVAESLKIAVNGSFGKFGSPYSKLYAPKLLIQTTITGQLALLMLIEQLEDAGISVVSANTDGVAIKCPRALVPHMEGVILDWELTTGFVTEGTEYRALYSRDVNNYIALKKDGGAKLKGVYAPAGLQKNPVNEVCAAAVVKFLSDGTPVEETIEGCQDMRKFVTIRQVKGGAEHHGAYLGKAIRWYYSIAALGVIKYKINGYTVPRTEGAQPCMELPDAIPADIDFSWYIEEANSILRDVGARAKLDDKFTGG